MSPTPNLHNWKAANQLFEQLADLPVDEALSALARMDDVTEEVSTIVTQLIEASQTTNEYVENQLINLPDLSTLHDQTGQQLEQYELLKEIGHGGMSRVYLAKRLNTENQKPVAIKVFNAPHNDERLLAQFEAEQKILAQLSHPNIIAMHHGGSTESGTSFLVMEWLEEARDIDQYCDQHALTNRAIIQLVIKAAHAIAYAHSQLVIHRDIKPSNILVSQTGEVKVVDFGIAKLIRQDQESDGHTILALTPSYASPEQINGQHISVQTDVFSLAALMIRLLTGESPFSQDRVIKACSGDEQRLDQVLRQPLFDADLRNILRKALKSDPDERYASMQQLADDLEAWVNHEPVTATPDSLWYQLNKFAVRRRALFYTGLTFVLTLTAGLGLLTWQYNKITLEAAKTEQVKNFMLDAFQSTDPDINKGEDMSAEQLLKTAAARLNSDAAMDPAIKFELLRTIGMAYGKLGYYQPALDNIRQSLLLQPNDSRSLSFQAEFLFHLAHFDQLNTLLEQLDTALMPPGDAARISRVKARMLTRDAQFDQAILLMQSVISQHMPENEDNHLNQQLLAELYYYRSEPQMAISTLEQVINDPRVDQRLMVIMDMHKDLGEYHMEVGNYQQANEGLQQLLATQKTVLGDEHPMMAKTLKLLGSTYMHLGQFDLSRQHVEASKAMHERLFGPLSLPTAYDLNTLAVIDHQTGHLQQAIKNMQQAVAIFDQHQALENTDSLEIKANLASLLNINDQSEEARDILQQVLAIQVDKLGHTHDSTLYTKKLLAYTLSKLGLHAEATTLIDQATAEAIGSHEMSHPIVVSMMYNQGKIYQRDGRHQAGIDKFKDMLDLQLVQPNHALYAKTLRAIAWGYLQLGDHDNTVAYYQACINNRIEMFGEAHLKTLEIQLDLTRYLHDSGHHSAAQQLHARMLTSAVALNMDEHPVIQGVRSLNTQTD